MVPLKFLCSKGDLRVLYQSLTWYQAFFPLTSPAPSRQGPSSHRRPPCSRKWPSRTPARRSPSLLPSAISLPVGAPPHPLRRRGHLPPPGFLPRQSAAPAPHLQQATVATALSLAISLLYGPSSLHYMSAPPLQPVASTSAAPLPPSALPPTAVPPTGVSPTRHLLPHTIEHGRSWHLWPHTQTSGPPQCAPSPPPSLLSPPERPTGCPHYPCFSSYGQPPHNGHRPCHLCADLCC